MLKFIFWLSIFIVIYVYLGYPLIIGILAVFLRKPINKADIEPSVSLIIVAYNEEDVIREKIENSLGLDYPEDKLEIIVASDGSTDRTNEIVGEYSSQGVLLNALTPNGGPTSAQNRTVPIARGDILVFSDANVMYKPRAIRKLVRSFNDPEVGGVSGELHFIPGEQDSSEKNETAYWSYETFLKHKESSLSSMTGSSGAMYALRRELYTPLDEAAIGDFAQPLKVASQGYRVVYEPEAVSMEELSSITVRGIGGRVRVALGGYHSLFEVKPLLNPFRYGFITWQLISHKVLRWMIPLFLIAIFSTNISLLRQGFLYQVVFIGQVIFYSLAGAGAIWEERRRRSKFFSSPFYFCFANLALLLGLYRYLRGERRTSWKTVRKKELVE